MPRQESSEERRNLRVVVLLIDHVDLRPGRELDIVVRALQSCRSEGLVCRMPFSEAARREGIGLGGVRS